MLKKKSFFERLTGGMRFDDEKEDSTTEGSVNKKDYGIDKNTINQVSKDPKKESKWEEEEEAQLSVDLYQTASDIIIQTMIAGVIPDNLSITITRDMVVIRGKREGNRSINSDSYFIQELYWGGFTRTISLPEEVDPEESEAIEKHGLLIITLPKINKDKKTTLKVKSM